MSRETSPGMGKPDGLERVCRVLDFPRSTIYAQQARESAQGISRHPVRRGPKPKSSDADLRVAIRADRAASPFVGEGHRKGGARRRIFSGIRVSQDRVGRLTRENALRSPHRVPQGAPVLHEGSIPTEAPHRGWGTDGLRIPTVADGGGWGFSAVDPFDACGVGIQAVKVGNRFAALQPMAQGLPSEFGTPGAHAGKGLKRRRDHGTPYPADDCLKQIAFWGIDKRFAFVAERFHRTLKSRRFRAASSATSKKYGRLLPSSEIATLIAGASKNGASCHPLKLGRLMPSGRPHELQIRVQSTAGGTYSRYRETFAEYEKSCKDFLNDLESHLPLLRSLLTENFAILGN